MRYIIPALIISISISISVPSKVMADSWYSGLIPGSKSSPSKGSSAYAKQRLKQRALNRTQSGKRQSKFVITGGGANTSGRLNYSPEKSRKLAREDYEKYRQAKSAELDTKKVKIKSRGTYGGTKEVSLREFQKMQRENVRAKYIQANAKTFAAAKKKNAERQKLRQEEHRKALEETNKQLSQNAMNRNNAREKTRGQSLARDF